MTTGKRITATFIAIALLLVVPAISSAQSGSDPVDRMDPVVLGGGDLDGIVGADIGKIRVFAYSKGAWTPIPFQIDRKIANGRGSVYVFDPSEDDDPLFDDNDELVVMARDFREKAPDGAPSIPGSEAPTAFREISVSGSSGKTGYAYVMVFDDPPAPSEIDYVNWDGGSRTVVSAEKYEVGYPEGEDLFFDKMAIAKENGGNGEDFVDTFKFRGNARIIAQLFIYDITNFHWRNTQTNVIDGPVRVIRRVRTRVSSTIFRIHIKSVDLVYYPDYFTMRVPAPMGVKRASIYYQADVRLSLDLSDDAPTMSFFNERNEPSPGLAADGRISDAEKNMDYRPIKWNCLSGKAGTVVMRLDQGRGAKTNQDLYYMDDASVTDPPENYPGHRGDTGFSVAKVEKIKRRERAFTMTFAFPSSKAAEQVTASMTVFDEPVTVTVNPGTVIVRTTKAQALPPDERKEAPSPSCERKSAGERTRAYLPQILADPNLGYGSGFQVVERKTFGTDLSTDVIFLISHRLYQSYRMTEIYPNLSPISEFKLQSTYLLHPNRYFYGIGNDREPDDLTVYKQEQFTVYLRLTKDITRWLGISGQYEVMRTNVGHGELTTGDEPSLEEKFGPDDEIIGERFGPEVYGLDGGFTNTLEFTLSLDFSDDRDYPTSGNYNEFTIRHCAPWLGSDYEYTQYRGDVSLYYSGILVHPEKVIPVKLWERNFIGIQTERVFALRFVAQRTDAPNVEFAGRTVKDIPFYNLSYFGDANSSRGHYWAQWADNDVAFAMFELRWRMYSIVDAALFYDLGRVFEDINNRAEWRETKWDDVHYSYGFGFRFNMVADIIMRFDYGISPENPGGLMYIEGGHTF